MKKQKSAKSYTENKYICIKCFLVFDWDGEIALADEQIKQRDFKFCTCTIQHFDYAMETTRWPIKLPDSCIKMTKVMKALYGTAGSK